MMSIPGYEIVALIYQSKKSIVYRGRKEKNEDVILKVLKEEYPTLEELTRYKQEFEITQNLNIENTIISYALEEYQNTRVIIFEDFGGISLDILLKKRQLNLKKFLEIAIKITTGLAEIHAANIIHKDLNPSNIVYNQETETLKIIDFGIATVLPKENQTLKNPNILEGTLAYISPEQTGRMNRALDYRSDFYSLGITFYELLALQLPFQSNDLLELIHYHIAKNPIPPHELNPEIPQVISDIILKLMAKNAGERYQSAWGIKVDLETCLEQLQTTSKIAKFQLARQDISGQFQLRQKLYGREKEIEILLKAISTGRFQREIMLISGYSGIGKSALVREVYKPITSFRGYFITGKFDQYQRDRPLSAIIQAFRQLAKYLLGESQSDLDRWKNKLLEALKDNGQIIIDLIPEIEQIIGKQPPVEDLGVTEAQNRFNWVFIKFVKVFARGEHPLVIFLDDLQWADSASLQLIQLIITEEEIEYLFLLGAYRDNEVSHGHPLRLTIDKIREVKVKVAEISLSALKLSDVTQLIADSFHCATEQAKPLAELVLSKTKGNPFFINEFLRSLYRENLLYFNYQSHNWQWDLEQIKAKGITDNVVELLSRSIQKLDQQRQNILQLAACIGNQFEIRTLATVAEKSLQETALLLRKGIELGLVFPLSDAYKSIELNVKQQREELQAEYKFVHDQIQQAAYSLIPIESRAKLHQKIGKLLLKSVAEEGLEENIFEIVNQLNLAIESISSQQERDELAKLNLIAGKKAKLSAAYEAAFKYLKLGRELLGENSWERNYKLTLKLYLAAAETACINATYDLAKQWSNEIIERAKNSTDRGQGYKTLVLACNISSDYSNALEIGILGLKEFGIIIPRTKIGIGLNILYQFIKYKFISTNQILARIKNLPEISDDRGLLSIELVENLRPIAYLISPTSYLLLTYKQVDLLLKYGISPSAYLTLLAYSILVCLILNDFESGYKLASEALFLQKSNDNKYSSTILFRFNALLRHSKEHLNKTLESLLEGYLQGLEAGEIKWTTANIAWYLFHSFIVGNKLKKVVRETEEYTKFIVSKIQPFSKDLLFFEYHDRAIKILRSSEFTKDLIEKKVATILKTDLVNSEKNNNIFVVYGNFYLIFCCYLFGKYIEANDGVNRAKQKINSVLGQAVVPLFYFYDSLNKIALISRDRFKYNKFFQEIAKNQQKIQKFADHAPMNYQHKYDLVQAELQRVKGNKEIAANLYEKAITGAKKHEYINEEALAWELAAKFYLQWDKPTIAKTYMIEAHYRYSLWGAIAKVKHLEENYPEFFEDIEEQKTEKLTTKSTTTTTKETNLQIFDVNTLLKANQILSRELNLAKLLAKLIKIALENAGARIGYLILQQEGNLTIEAIGSVKSTQVSVLQSLAINSKNPQTQLPLLPEKIINYVVRTHQDIVIDNARSYVEFANDPYIEKIRPKSILCAPLVDRGKLIGLIYLENNLTTKAFTPNRSQLLKALCAPAAVSIQNAQLYQERTKAELALRQSERKLAQFLEALPVGIFIFTNVGKPYYLNQIAKQMTGKGLVDSIEFDQFSETYNIHLAGSDRLYPREKSPIPKALKGEKSYTPDVEIRKPGATIPLDVWTSPIVNEVGEVEYVISAFQDISDRKRLEEENLLLQQVGDDLSYSYQIGGGLAANASSYVVRDADRQLYQEILQGKLCYIFNSRQMGKSSLRNKIMSQLRSKGYHCGAIDLTEIGCSNLNPEQWYASLIFNLAKSLAIFQFNNRKNFAQWWKSLDPISVVSKFKEFICEIILKNIDGKIVIFIDEIDSIRRLSFAANDFLALIRFLYESRCQNPDLNRLTFVLLGAANPSTLISDPNSTPFNIGTPISLAGFKIHEIQPLAAGLADICDDSKTVLQEILAWTGGQPFLTQKICYLIKQSRHNIAAGTETKAIEELVKERIITNWKIQDNPSHFQVIEQNILNSPNRLNLLEIYQKILQSKQITLDDYEPKMELILSGLVCYQEGFLKVFNQIYASIFNLDWVEQNS